MTKRRPRTFWTEQMDEVLLAGFRRHMTMDELSERLGVPEKSCRARLIKVRTKVGEWSDRRKLVQILPALNPNLKDNSCPKFARHDLHLRLIAQALIARDIHTVKDVCGQMRNAVPPPLPPRAEQVTVAP